MPVETIQWDKHDIVPCDERGRATLGTEFAGQRVFVYIAELPDFDEIDSEPVSDETQDVLIKMYRYMREHDIDSMVHLFDPEFGVITDKDGNTHDTPYGIDA